MILSILITTVGFFFVLRIAHDLMTFFDLDDVRKIRCRLFLVFSHWIFWIFFRDRPLVLWIFFLLVILTSQILSMAWKSRMEWRLKETALEFLDQICLGIQTGQSLRSAWKRTFFHRNDWCAKQIKNSVQSLLDSDQIRPQNSTFLNEFKRELLQIDQSGQKITEQIARWRRCLKTELDFRRRSGQVLRNIRIQSFVMTILYGIFAVFISTQVDLRQFPRLIATSVLLFIVGLIFVALSGRKLRWKV